ncbi:unnamed protein product [Durusdinium trenchii]|uniref:HEAT repeat-containing protein 1 n=1 Tax=Durusdinium trenchii TaxID=1381693 RepID=A0ABP0IG08_9DINO
MLAIIVLYHSLHRHVVVQSNPLSKAALLASCLARMRYHDPVLLRGARRVVEQTVFEAPSDPATLQRCAMLLEASAVLEPRLQSREALVQTVVTTLRSRCNEEVDAPPVLHRSLLSLLRAELASQEEPSELMQIVAEYLAVERCLWPVHSLGSVATALQRWGRQCPAMPQVATGLLRVLQRRLSRPQHRGISPELLLKCLGAALPLAPEHRHGWYDFQLQQILKQLLPKAADLRPGQLVALVELSGMAWEGANPDFREALQAPFEALRSTVYQRLRQLPLRALPAVLAALLQMVSKESIETDLWPVLRRSTGLLGYQIREVVEGSTSSSLEDFDFDALGEVFYICAASNFQDVAFFESSEAWLLKQHQSTEFKPLTLVHLLHSAAVLRVAKGRLLHLLVAASVQRINHFGAFEVLGFLDAAALLQREADQPSPAEFLEHVEGPPPSGVGEEALQEALARVVALLPSLDDDELRPFVPLLRSMRLPSGPRAERIYQEAADRGLDEKKQCSGPASQRFRECHL